MVRNGGNCRTIEDVRRPLLVHGRLGSVDSLGIEDESHTRGQACSVHKDARSPLDNFPPNPLISTALFSFSQLGNTALLRPQPSSLQPAARMADTPRRRSEDAAVR